MAGPFQIVRYGRHEMQQHEHSLAPASADVYPGMLLDRVNDGGDIKVQPHGAAATAAQPFVATEARGRGMSASSDQLGGDALEAYSIGGDEFVRYMDASGGGLYARVAPGEVIEPGEGLVSNGDGNFRAYEPAGTTPDDPAAIVLEAEEASDDTGGTEPVLVKATTA